jgi:hypothetical protein
MTGRNFHLSSRRQCFILRNPRNVPMHDPGKAADLLEVDDSLPAAAGGVLHVVVDVDDGG